MGRPAEAAWDAADLSGYPQQSHPDGKKVMEQIARETGGRFFEVSKKQSIDQIYASIEEELRNQYSLGYTPDKADAAPGYHKIHLTTTQKDLVVQTRDGYYSSGSGTAVGLGSAQHPAKRLLLEYQSRRSSLRPGASSTLFSGASRGARSCFAGSGIGGMRRPVRDDLARDLSQFHGGKLHATKRPHHIFGAFAPRHGRTGRNLKLRWWPH